MAADPTYVQSLNPSTSVPVATTERPFSGTADSKMAVQHIIFTDASSDVQASVRSYANGNPVAVALTGPDGSHFDALSVHLVNSVNGTVAIAGTIAVDSIDGRVAVVGAIDVNSTHGTVAVAGNVDVNTVHGHVAVIGDVGVTQATSPWITQAGSSGAQLGLVGQTGTWSVHAAIASLHASVGVVGTVAVDSINGTVAVTGAVDANSVHATATIVNTLHVVTQGGAGSSTESVFATQQGSWRVDAAIVNSLDGRVSIDGAVAVSSIDGNVQLVNSIDGRVGLHGGSAMVWQGGNWTVLQGGGNWGVDAAQDGAWVVGQDGAWNVGQTGTWSVHAHVASLHASVAVIGNVTVNSIDGNVAVVGAVDVNSIDGNVEIVGTVDAAQSGAWNVGQTGTWSVHAAVASLHANVSVVDAIDVNSIDGNVTVVNTVHVVPPSSVNVLGTVVASVIGVTAASVAGTVVASVPGPIYAAIGSHAVDPAVAFVAGSNTQPFSGGGGALDVRPIPTTLAASMHFSAEVFSRAAGPFTYAVSATIPGVEGYAAFQLFLRVSVVDTPTDLLVRPQFGFGTGSYYDVGQGRWLDYRVTDDLARDGYQRVLTGPVMGSDFALVLEGDTNGGSGSFEVDAAIAFTAHEVG